MSDSQSESIYDVPHCPRPLDAVVRLPGSKSLTNRALIVSALADGTSGLEGALFCDDSRRLMTALTQLGYRVEADEEREFVEVHGGGAKPLLASESGIGCGQTPERVLDAGASGTSMRFLTALVTLGRGMYRIDGDARMRERPIEPLLEALRHLGADARSERGNGCPPVRVAASGLRGGSVAIAGDVSSQFLSALLMVAPYARGGVHIMVRGELVSRPYVEMTCALMQSFGARVDVQPGDRYGISPTPYQAQAYRIEPDASGSSYFMAAAAICGGRVSIPGLSRDALQGDVHFADVLEQMGCGVQWRADGLEVTGPQSGLAGVDVDLRHMSDCLPTLAAIAPLASAPVRIRNVANTRLKETDRIAACADELRRFGVTVQEHEDGLEIQPCPDLKTGVHVRTYADHRMAMAFAILGLRVPGTHILDPACVAKTFPGFFAKLERTIADSHGSRNSSHVL
ncbi:MAG: 3-phosphoshikimate 1-carboxyvinyltransferase [Firmicutes bacterium]|nr:3-phosphoshikimate 1-carboxyvinyltransferase [Bacillota bacterium]